MAEPVEIPFEVSNSDACPICTKTSALRYQPFCSKRCADVDLHRWLSGGYAVPSERVEDGDDAISTDEL